MLQALSETLTGRWSATMCDRQKLSPMEMEQRRAESYNASEGHRNEEDGFECKLCKNKALIAKIAESPDGSWYCKVSDCKCANTRKSIMRMKRSGLEKVIKNYTFDTFRAEDQWQKVVKAAAMDYAETAVGWFFLGGQPGSGKTHLCTSICREFLLRGRQVIYMMWRDDVTKLKDFSIDSEERMSMMERYKRADVLYIDDLFKTGRGEDGRVKRPSGADITTAFELLNYRYNNPELLTVISSEWTDSELLDIDEAVGSRIYERAKTLSIARDKSRNYRTRAAVNV